MWSEYVNCNLKVLCLKCNKEVGEEIGKDIGVGVGKCCVDGFSDGEVEIKIEESMGGWDV
uniref:ribose-phosphate pyrophosphokinase-like domain-containing protein n=1 Tax=Bacillus thuringiensis TaxID=1428 RepID=UPI0021B65B8F